MKLQGKKTKAKKREFYNSRPEEKKESFVKRKEEKMQKNSHLIRISESIIG